ncbi:MAG: hypothetical protein KF768_03535 [Phycisphaeraceae bacterium]|nr:hypothetical protein [Phycisphaeraceae bacterium]
MGVIEGRAGAAVGGGGVKTGVEADGRDGAARSERGACRPGCCGWVVGAGRSAGSRRSRLRVGAATSRSRPGFARGAGDGAAGVGACAGRAWGAGVCGAAGRGSVVGDALRFRPCLRATLVSMLGVCRVGAVGRAVGCGDGAARVGSVGRA